MISWDSIETIIIEPILILNDRAYNPIETVILCSDKHAIKKNVPTLSDTDGCFRVLSFDQLGITKKWKAELFDRSEKIGHKVYLLSSEDAEIIKMIYALCICKKNCWVSKNLELAEYQLESKLAMYLERYSYTFNSIKIRNFDYAKRIFTMYRNHLILSWKEKITIFYDKLIEKPFRIAGRVYRSLTRKKYMKSITATHPDWEIDYYYKCSESNSGCVFLSVKDENNKIFVKGNEPPVFKSIKNEICINNQLKNDAVAKEVFVLSVAADSFFRWIAFPFSDDILLSDQIKERPLNQNELELLARFLLKALDCLAAKKIVHRDIRLENIMCKLNTEGEVKSFRLIDFGCSVFDGKDIWKYSLCDRHMADVVCGENRYNDITVDDAAAAHSVYIECGGEKGDVLSGEFLKRIGRYYYSRRC